MAQVEKWAEDLKSLQKLTQTLKRSLNKVGGASDTTTFRSQLTVKQNEGTDIVNRMEKRINEYKRQSMTSRDGDKLLKQYNDLKNSFETTNDEINVKKRQYTAVEPAGDDGNDNVSPYGSSGEDNGMQSQQELQPVSQEALSAVSLAEERNQQVTKIAQDVVEIKEAFDDLNELVDEQQQHLDHIEANVVETKEQVIAGTEHLKKAESHQISARKKQCMALACLLIIIAIIVIPIVVTNN